MTAQEVLRLLEAPQDLEAIKRMANEGEVHPDHGYSRKLRIAKAASIKVLLVALEDALKTCEEGTVVALCEILGWRRARSATPLLCPLLRSDSRSLRALVADSLGKIGGKRAGECVLQALPFETDTMVRPCLILALGDMKHFPAVPFLLDALTEDNAQVRAFAAFGLGYLEERAAVTRLTAALGDSDARVRANAARALKKLGAYPSRP